MRTAFRLILAATLSLTATTRALATTVAQVDIRGLDAPMTQNVRDALSLVDAIGKDVSDRRLAYLLRQAMPETRDSLAPFGYFSPTIHVERTGAGTPTGTIVTITVDRGAPVRVRASHVAIDGAGGGDSALQQELATFTPAIGDVFNQGVYEDSKTRVSRRLAERGYFDADFLTRRVEVTRAANAADIDLVWASGARYAMGPATFTQEPDAILRDALLHKLVRWTPGSPFEQDKLDRLRKSLVALDDFSGIDITPHPDRAVDHKVPVTVTLKPAKRSIYTAGLSYGTDSGAGVRLGVERRYLNSRGHKALAQVDYAQRRKTLTLQYRIPAFAWLDGWYTASLQAADEQTDYIDTRRVELVGSRSGTINSHLIAVAALHVLRERWAYPTDTGHTAYEYGSFLFPSLRGDYIDVDDRLYPRRGMGTSLELRGGSKGLGSDATFFQLHGRASWFHGLGTRDRLILRGELGHTFTEEVVDLPPSLRFYAGGDRSIRGYNDREVGPRLGTFGLGANNLLTASSEFEHYFTQEWGGAVFVDTGSAFNGRTPDWHTGVGVGVRWRSPVGPVRVDVARGLDQPDSPLTVYLNIGADL
jgi:translocation and assembly module TamA